MRSKTSNMGFTLLELMVVIIIMAILASIVVPSYIGLKSMAIQTRMSTLGANMISAANLANAYAITKGFSQGATGDLEVAGDGAAVYGFPKADKICDLLRLSEMPAVTCVNGVATATDATNPTACKITYIDAVSLDGPTIDISALTNTNC